MKNVPRFGVNAPSSHKTTKCTRRGRAEQHTAKYIICLTESKAFPTVKDQTPRREAEKEGRERRGCRGNEGAREREGQRGREGEREGGERERIIIYI